jgi:hypothetical protein
MYRMSFSLEVRHGGEDAAGDHISLDLAEPQFDLVEPGRVGRGEVHMNVGMFGQVQAEALVPRALPVALAEPLA